MILVTGGTGLIGSHLLFHLVSNGKAVRSNYR
ncbi:MAG: NAD-dependent epimerase/dehydratase family protein, partial [Bacteroidota bacterium]|nr:NAD-dependent epimerase/dehydratase family protein [Bacteroidota bacterium]